MENVKVIAFDCDGVMFDTEKSNRMYYNRILSHLGQPPLTDEQFRYTHMHTVHGALDYLFPDRSLRARAEESRKEMNYFSLIRYMEIEPFLKPFVQQLRRKRKTAIATNRSDTMDRVLEEHGLVGYFDLVVSARDVEHPKPAPDPLIAILKHFDANPDEAIYIGDSEVDEQAAAAAGIPLIAFKNSSLNARFHADSMQEVARLFNIDV